MTGDYTWADFKRQEAIIDEAIDHRRKHVMDKVNNDWVCRWCGSTYRSVFDAARHERGERNDTDAP